LLDSAGFILQPATSNELKINNFFMHLFMLRHR